MWFTLYSTVQARKGEREEEEKEKEKNNRNNVDAEGGPEETLGGD